MKIAERCKIEILGNTKISLDKVALFNLDSIVSITARDFNAETDIVEPWAERENIQGKNMNADSSEESGCKSTIGMPIAVLCLLPFVWILAKKEKENA